MEKQKINKPNFSVLNNKMTILICLTLLAGTLDIYTTIIGINSFGLYEVNLINRLYFPIGIVIWVTYTLTILGIVEKVKPKGADWIQFFIVGFCFYAPISNLGLILGCLT